MLRFVLHGPDNQLIVLTTTGKKLVIIRKSHAIREVFVILIRMGNQVLKSVKLFFSNLLMVIFPNLNIACILLSFQRQCKQTIISALADHVNLFFRNLKRDQRIEIRVIL